MSVISEGSTEPMSVISEGSTEPMSTSLYLRVLQNQCLLYYIGGLTFITQLSAKYISITSC